MADAKKRIGTVEKILCAWCKRRTDHTIRGAHDTSWDEGDEGERGHDAHDLMSCNGCGSVTYRDTGWSTYEPEGSSVDFYPPRDPPNALKRQPRDYEHLPWGSPLEAVYRQTIEAYVQKLNTLSGAGVRLLIEGVCKEQGIKDGPVFDKATKKPSVNKTGKPVRAKNLEGKINGLVERGIATKSQAEHLHEIRFLGNDAAHELDQPLTKIVCNAIDIVEHLFEQIYELPAKANAIAARKRPKK